MNTPEREKFEAWCKSQGWIPALVDTTVEWKCWRAALATRNEEHEAKVKELEAEIEQANETRFEAKRIRDVMLQEQAKRIEQLQAQVAMKDEALVQGRQAICKLAGGFPPQYVAALQDAVGGMTKALTASQSNWLEKKLLEARIDELVNGTTFTTARLNQLREHLAELEE